MFKAIVLTKEDVVIINNDDSVSRWDIACSYNPIQGYFDDVFSLSFTGRTMFRFKEAITVDNSFSLRYDSSVGVTILPNGEVFSLSYTEGEMPDDTTKTQIIKDFQGLLFGLSNWIVSTDDYILHSLRNLVVENESKIDINLLFETIKYSDKTSETLDVFRISKNHLLKSLALVEKGIPLTEIEKVWEHQRFIRPTIIKTLGLNDVQEFNRNNLAHMTVFSTIVTGE